MLAADKANLEYQLSQQVLQLQWKELQYIHMNLQNLATSAAVLVGFGIYSGASSRYAYSDSVQKDNFWAHAVQFDGWKLAGSVIESVIGGFLSLAIACNLIVLFLATITCMTGSGMALRGPEGSVGVAVRHMEEQNKRALRFFGRGITFFTLYLTTVGARQVFDLGIGDGVIGICVGCYTLFTLQRYGADIAEKFHVSKERLVRGTFGDVNGMVRWQRHASESFNEGPRLWSARWRPPGHGRMTPLWRLDKLISFPYLNVENMSERFSAAEKHQDQVHDLVLRMQGRVVTEPPAQADVIERLSSQVIDSTREAAAPPAGGGLAEADAPRQWAWWGPWGRGEAPERQRMRAVSFEQPAAGGSEGGASNAAASSQETARFAPGSSRYRGPDGV